MFLFLAGVATIATALLWIAMPETRPGPKAPPAGSQKLDAEEATLPA
jgi:predicted MFS family arabinose efflux permease